MQNVRKWIVSNRSKLLGSVYKSPNAFRSILEYKPSGEVSRPPFSSPLSIAATNPTKGLGAIGAKGSHVNRRPSVGDKIIMFCSSPSQMRKYELHNTFPSFARAFAIRAPKEPEGTRSEAKKDVSTVEDPFDAPTYHIPEKPVTFTEGASYSLVILAGLGVAAAAAYAVFKELILQPKEYKIFNIALKRIQDDSQVRMRIGSPITGYGQDSRNRAARQRIPNKIYTDEDGAEHVEVNFYIRGPHGAGKVFAHMFKDKADKQWKYTYLVVQINSPSPVELMLESYLPAYEPTS